MSLNILAVGDVTGEPGLRFLEQHLRPLKKLKQIHFTVVNGENADGVGILPWQAEAIFDAGADVITLGNHTWNRHQILPLLEENPYLLRPANRGKRIAGRGWGVYPCQHYQIGVINLLGRCAMDFGTDDPFACADGILDALDANVILVDFHAEATSEKLAMGYHLDGRVAALWGTHTHVPTADARIYPKGTGYITDLGMTGPIESVLGIRPEQSLTMFTGGLPGRFEAAPGPCKLEGCIFAVDPKTGLCNEVERLSIQ